MIAAWHAARKLHKKVRRRWKQWNLSSFVCRIFVAFIALVPIGLFWGLIWGAN
jgi:hypothetical protein